MLVCKLPKGTNDIDNQSNKDNTTMTSSNPFDNASEITFADAVAADFDEIKTSLFNSYLADGMSYEDASSKAHDVASETVASLTATNI